MLEQSTLVFLKLGKLSGFLFIQEKSLHVGHPLFQSSNAVRKIFEEFLLSIGAGPQSSPVNLARGSNCHYDCDHRP